MTSTTEFTPLTGPVLTFDGAEDVPTDADRAMLSGRKMVEFYGQLVVVARCSTAQEAFLVVLCFPSQWLILCFMLLPHATAPGRLLALRFLFRMCSPPGYQGDEDQWRAGLSSGVGVVGPVD
jgi:hypothetical protein